MDVRLIYQEDKFFMNIDGVRICFHIIYCDCNQMYPCDWLSNPLWFENRWIGVLVQYLSNNRALTRLDETRSIYLQLLKKHIGEEKKKEPLDRLLFSDTCENWR
jgi:hypothetical protein